MKDIDRIQSLFSRARELRQEERTAFLVAECGQDSELQREVESLLAHERAVPKIIDTPVVEIDLTDLMSDAGSSLELPAGTEVGPYMIEKRIGHGTFGDVYLAQQESPLRRPVAIKVIRPGMDTRAVIARFEQERQALAIMNHTGVAKVLDAGTTAAGRPFFVMEHVPGVPVTDFCRDHHLVLEQRLRLFIRVCDAVQHAHQKGIVHRDIKPANILAFLEDGLPIAKVIDFGIAKALVPMSEAISTTQAERPIGTPAYMSPEQTGSGTGVVDTRTDVYALGVLLYELVTDRLPFESKREGSAALAEVIEAIRTAAPPIPSSRNTAWSKQLRGDLDWIVLKALEKEMDRRYSSASELAADVVRHLENEPVLARPPSASYRLGKLIRRNKGAALASVAVLLALMASLVLLWIAVQANRQLAVESALKGESLGLLARVLRLSNPTDSELPASSGELTLGQALEFFDAETRDHYRAHPLFQAELDNAIGSIYAGRGDIDKARERLLAALNARRTSLGPDHADTLSSVVELGSLECIAGRFEESARLLRDAVRRSADHFGPFSAISLVAREKLAELLQDTQQFDESEALYRKTLGDARISPHADELQVLSMWGGLANVLTLQKKWDEAEALLKKVVEARQARQGPDHPDTLGARTNLAGYYWSRGQRQLAIPMIQDIFVSHQRRLGPNHPLTIQALHNLGVFSEGVDGKFIDSERYTRDSVARATVAFGASAGTTALYRAAHGMYLLYTDNHAEAETELLKAYEDLVRTRGPDNRYTLSCAKRLAQLYERLEKPAKVTEWMTRANPVKSSEK